LKKKKKPTTLIFALVLPIIITITKKEKKKKKKTLQISCATNECDNDSKNGISYKNGWLPKKTKNVTPKKKKKKD